MGILDQNIFFVFFNFARRSSLLDAFGVFLAEGVLYLAIILAVVFVYTRRSWRKRLFVLLEMALVIILSRGLVAEVIYFFYHKARPFQVFGFEPLVSASGYSFPSGHVTVLFALATTILLLNKTWGAWFMTFSFLSAMARIYAGVHWPVDILGGLILGAGMSFVVHLALKGQKDSVFKQEKPSA